jgi:hydroxypyruvate isomerase
MPRFAANLGWLFTEHAFLDRFGAAREAGFTAVEFASPYEHSPAQIARRLDAHGLECILFNLPMGDKSRGDFGIACRPERRAEFGEGLERALDYARALRPTRINCIAGLAGDGADRGSCERTLIANLRVAAGQLGEAGIELVIEPINSVDVPGFILPTCGAAAALIGEAATGNLALQCDLYHTAMMGDDPSAILSSLRGIIRHVQFADVPGRGEPGTGSLPLAQLFEAIDALGYDGWVAAEYKPTRRTEATLGWLTDKS